jgi:hypothetical protein
VARRKLITHSCIEELADADHYLVVGKVREKD